MSKSKHLNCRSRRIGLVSTGLPLTRSQKRRVASMARADRRREEREREENRRKSADHLGPELKKIDPESEFGQKREARIAKYIKLAEGRAELFDGADDANESSEDEEE